MSLKPGTAVGPYEIVSPLGAGGMGEVYRAFDRKLNRHVALKILSADLASSGEHLRRFEQEARAASALNHPNIISIYDIGRSGDLAYIVMELVEGRDLRTLAAEDTLNLKQILRIASKVADGLAAAHERGIVHRDLKPENIMMSSDGFVKILDFGLAKLVAPWGAEETTLPHTTPGQVFGTVGYMSPEQAAGRPTDFHADQFSLAVIVYELIARKRPFERPTSPETMAAIIREQPEPLSSFDRAIPPQLERIIERCLEKNPRERYGSTRDLARDIREVRDTLTQPSYPGRRSSAPRPVVIRRVSPIAAVVAAVVMAAGIGYVAWRNAHQGGQPSQAKAIAILPFRDSSGSGVNQDLADGLSETIGARLAQAASLRVIGPFDGVALADNTPAAEVARRRSADVVLRGTIQRSGDKLRVAYRLLDAKGREVMADSLTASTGDLFAVEDGIAERIKTALHAGGSTPVASSAEALQGKDQQVYLEAIGLLQKSRDVAAVESAIAKLEQLLNDARDSANVNATLASAYVSRYQLTKNTAFVDQASLYADRALQIDPALPQAHASAGRVAMVKGNFPVAVTEFQRALALQPNLSGAISGLADAYDKMGRGAEAERWFRQAIHVRPDHYAPYNSYGTFLYAHSRYAEASVQFERVTELLPDSSRGFNNLGAVYQRIGRYDEAVAAYRRAVKIDPTAGSAWSNLSACYFFLGQYDNACSAGEQATRLRPEDSTSWQNLGDAYRWAPGRRASAAAAYDKAIALARKTLELNPKDVSAHEQLALASAKKGDAQTAQREIDAALHIDPTDANALYAAAVISTLGGQPDRAVAWLSRAIGAGYGADDARRDPELGPIRNAPGYTEAFRARSKS